MQILYEDDAVIVCVKPAGIATQTEKIGQQDMESMLRNYRAGKGEPPYIAVVHRLDQPVGGVMVFAKTKEAAADLSRQIAEKRADKYYYAVVEGVPNPPRGTLENYLLRDGRTNTSKVVGKGTAGAKKAVLSYEVKVQKGDKALVCIRLETGRHHQIRVQMANAGFPLAGDKKYNRKAGQETKAGQLALCAFRLCFRHPLTGEKMDFEIENPFEIK